MLVAYLSNERILLNADLYSPRGPSTAPPTAAMKTLRQNIILKWKSDPERHVGLHGGVATNDEFMAMFPDAASTN